MNKKTFLCLLFAALLFRSFTTVSLGATMSSIPCILLIIYAFFIPDATRHKMPYIIVSAIFTIVILLAHGVLEAKDCALFFFSFISLDFFAKHFSFGPDELCKYMIIVILPQILYYIILSGKFMAFLPNQEGLVDLSCGFGTKHYTGDIGYLCFIAALYYIHLDRMAIGKISKPHVCLFLIGVYLTVFSSSRSYTLGMIATFVLYYINRFKVRKKLSWVFFILTVSSTFFMEMVAQWVPYINRIEWLADFIHVENFESHGVTSGRYWLWGYHIQSFLNNPLFGGGRDAVDFFVGQWIGKLGIEANAGSESPFTGMLACYGMIGVCMLILLICMFKKAVDRYNVVALCIIYSMLYNSVMGTGLTSVLTGHAIVLYLLFFTSLRLTNKNIHK